MAWLAKNAISTDGSISDEHDRGEDGCLRPEHGQPLRHRGEARSDHPGRVLSR